MRQAVESLRLGNPKLSIGLLSGLFGKTREGYYSVGREKREQRTLKESTIIKAVRDIRSEAPRIGAQKLLYMLKDVYPDLMTGARSSTSLCISTILYLSLRVAAIQPTPITTTSSTRT